MAVSPGIQSLIDAFHASPRDEGWAQNVADTYAAAIASVEVPDLPGAAPEFLEMLRVKVVQETLRQHVDEDILSDVIAVTETIPGENFVEGLTERASDWPPAPTPFSDEELEAGSLRRNPQAEEIYPAGAHLMANQAREGAQADLINTLLLLQQRGNEVRYQPVNAPGEQVAGSLTAEGQSLFDYVQETIAEANSQLEPITYAREVIYSLDEDGEFVLDDNGNRVVEGYGDYLLDDEGNKVLQNNRPFDPDQNGTEYREGVLITLNPEEMLQLMRTKITQDIQNGTFPIPGLDVSDAERIAQQLYEGAFQRAERTGVDVGGSGPGLDGSGRVLNYQFRVPDSALAEAIDGMFLGENPVLDTSAQLGLNAGQFTEEYLDVMNGPGAGMTADDLIEHFTKLVEGYTDNRVNPPEEIPPTMTVPDHMREQFYNSIREAYDASRRADPNDPDSILTKNFDPDVFGRVMEERFGIIDAEHSVDPMNREALDYGAEIPVQLGAETENGFQVVNEAGEVMFEISVEDGFAIYAARSNGEQLIMDEMRGVESKEALRELLGDEGFTIRAVSPLDTGLDGADTGVSGYYVSAPGTGNSFHIGFDAVPEAGVSDAFRAARDTGFDTRDAEPGLEVAPGFVIGDVDAPEAAEVVPVDRTPPPVTLGAPS